MKKSNPLSWLAICLLLMLCACNKADKSTSGNAAEVPANAVPADATTNAETPANPCAAPQHSGLRMRGQVMNVANKLQFRPCNSELFLSLQDTESGLLSGLVQQLGNKEEGMYVQFDVASDGENIVLEHLWRASPTDESLGCKEDLSGLIYLARGNEPFWGIELRDSGEVALLRPGTADSGIDELIFTKATLERDAKTATISAIDPAGGPGISIELHEGICIDSMAGDWFGMNAEVTFGETVYRGCAWPGEAVEFAAQE